MGARAWVWPRLGAREEEWIWPLSGREERWGLGPLMELERRSRLALFLGSIDLATSEADVEAWDRLLRDPENIIVFCPTTELERRREFSP